MDKKGWTNERTIEFIQLIEEEPTLWKPNIKNRKAIREAWNRVGDAFSMQISIEECKKKKNVLLTQYRDTLKRLQKNADNSEAGETPQPTWFAFQAMHNFLWEVYENGARSNKNRFNLKAESLSPDEFEEQYEYIEEDEIENTDEELHSSNNFSRESKTARERLPSTANYGKRRRNSDQKIEFWTGSPQTDPIATTYERERTSSHKNTKSKDDECDLYTQLLAQKLKKLDEEARLRLMNDIDNMAFKYLLEAKRQNVQSSDSVTSPPQSTS